MAVVKLICLALVLFYAMHFGGCIDPPKKKKPSQLWRLYYANQEQRIPEYEPPPITLEDIKMDPGQLRRLIRETLQPIGLYSLPAEELLMLTAAVESNLGHYIYQVRGPARGIFQMEPTTEKCLWDNFIKYKSEELQEDISEYDTIDEDDLSYNLAYQVIMARMHYLRVPKPLPRSHDRRALAQYWKDHYNTHLGRGTVEKALTKYGRYVMEES